MPILSKRRTEILTSALTARRDGIEDHQINIDNYRLAIAKIEAEHADDKGLQEFANHLRELLASSILEQSKERILAEVIHGQLFD